MARTLYRQFEGLNHELDTKAFHVNFACFVGEINGGGFAPMVYEMLEMRFRGIILGFRRDPLEGGGQLKKLEEMPELWEKVLAFDVQKRDKRPRRVGAVIGIVITVAGGID